MKTRNEARRRPSRRWRLVLAAVILLAILITPLTVGSSAPHINVVHDYLSLGVASAQGSELREVPAYLEPTVAQKSANLYEVIYTDRDFVGSVQIGDEKASEFTPQVELLRWGGEARITLGPPIVGGTQLSTGQASASLSSESISWGSGDVEVLFYPLPKTESDSYGQFEYEIVLNSKPSTNTISMPMELHNLVAHYQSPLTAEYHNGWSDEFQCELLVTATDVREASTGVTLVHRPENVVGSYAVYSSSDGGMNEGAYNGAKYKTGKAFHIYRPKIVDSAGKWVWGALHIEHGAMTVTIPQSFLDTAKYPVRHAAGATFGYTSKGTSYRNNLPDDYLWSHAGSYTPASAGTLDKMTTYCAGYDTCTFGVYKVSDDSFVAGSESKKMNSSEGWQDSSFDGEAISAVAYRLVIWPDDDLNRVWYDQTAGCERYDDAHAYGTGWPDPANWNEFGSYLRQWSMYVTYTPSSPDIEITPTSENFGTVAESSTYWAAGSTPGWPLGDGSCTFTITNNSGFAVDITAKATNFTGGSGWSLTSGSPGEDTVRLTAFKSGDGSGDGVALTTSGQSFITNLSDSSTKKAELKLETGTFTDGTQRTSTVTFTAAAS